MTDNIESLAHNLDERQRALFLSALIEKRKDPWLAGLLTLTFGGLGAHRFYLGQTTPGIIYACCFIPYFIVSMFALGIPLVIPALVLIVEACFASRRVREYNEALKNRLATQVKRPAASPH